MHVLRLYANRSQQRLRPPVAVFAALRCSGSRGGRAASCLARSKSQAVVSPGASLGFNACKPRRHRVAVSGAFGATFAGVGFGGVELGYQALYRVVQRFTGIGGGNFRDPGVQFFNKRKLNI
ncbi:MAG: hypothetical protein IPL70_13390 [Uliginosibacterium sp.]|nr:hypothetical protein [Uliginosibacterium sp.]